jgi:hypothetical protein
MEGTTAMSAYLQIEVARHYQRETLAQVHQRRLRRQARSAASQSSSRRAAQPQPGRPLRQTLRLLTSRAPAAAPAPRPAASLTIVPQSDR